MIEWRAIAVAIAISGAVHASVIALGHVELPHRSPDPPPLALRIERIPAPAETAPRPVVRPRIARAPQALRVPSAPVVALPAQTDAVASGVTDEFAQKSGADSRSAAAAPTVLAKAEPSTFSPEPPPLRSLPRRGQIIYNLVYGRDRFPVGRTVQTWQIDGSVYHIASASETTGIVDFFRSQHRNYMSRGVITREGLKPDSFLMSRNRGRGLEEARAEFDWGGSTITLGPPAEQRREALPEGSQDLVSFIYQLALNPPPPGRLRVPITNGSRLEVYQLDVLPEESIETPLGVMRALPLRQVRTAGAESIEVWLASEYRYLPVRIRFIDREGQAAGEQIVREIRLGDD